MIYRVALIFGLLMISSASFAQLSDREVIDLKSGRSRDDTSYVYWLPYENGKRYLLVQAANSSMSHRSELSLDFKMKKGSKICAAREGTVLNFRDDSEAGGLKEENLSDGNYIVISHSDGSLSSYWHLQKNSVCVKVGDEVRKGQVIAASGNTGFSAFPHLHFQVTDKSGKQVMVRFQSKQGSKYLRPGKWYRAIHGATAH